MLIVTPASQRHHVQHAARCIHPVKPLRRVAQQAVCRATPGSCRDQGCVEALILIAPLICAHHDELKCGRAEWEEGDGPRGGCPAPAIAHVIARPLRRYMYSMARADGRHVIVCVGNVHPQHRWRHWTQPAQVGPHDKHVVIPSGRVHLLGANQLCSTLAAGVPARAAGSPCAADFYAWGRRCPAGSRRMSQVAQAQQQAAAQRARSCRHTRTYRKHLSPGRKQLISIHETVHIRAARADHILLERAVHLLLNEASDEPYDADCDRIICQGEGRL